MYLLLYPEIIDPNLLSAIDTVLESASTLGIHTACLPACQCKFFGKKGRIVQKTSPRHGRGDDV